MRYLLDANAVIGLFKGHATLTRRLLRRRPGDFGIPSIAAYELFFGAYKGQRTERSLAQIDALLFEVLEFDREDARQAGEIRADLARAGMSIGSFEVLIAGQAKARGLTLITHNAREFCRISGLSVEDWEVA